MNLLLLTAHSWGEGIGGERGWMRCRLQQMLLISQSSSQQMQNRLPTRVLKASTNAQELERLNKDIDEMRHSFHMQISASILKALQEISPPPIPILDSDAVGIEEKINEVIEQLDFENDNTTTAVIVFGIGGSGKTTLADAVYASLGDKLHSDGWKHSRVTLIQNLESNPNIEELQSLILQDLTGIKQYVRDFKSGRESLKDILEKEHVFLYIDNALYPEPLNKLLPKDVRNAKKFRLLLTARESTILMETDACGVELSKLYRMEPLCIDAALQILCRKIDIKREKDSILKERPQAKMIAEKCNSCPLFLEVIGAYLHQRKNTVKAYERVLEWLRSGEDFGGSEKFGFDDKRVLFSYKGLRPTTKEAFLDLCSFFYGWKWNWESVECILGKEEMVCLEEGALIKREEDNKIKIHDLILLAGRNKSKDSRLRNIEDLVSKNKEQVSELKGIWMEDCRSPSTISAEELDATKRSLRILYLPSMVHVKGKCREHFDQLRFLHVENQLPVNISIFKFQHLRYLSINYVKEDINLSPSMNLPNLNVLKFSCCRIHGIAEIGHILPKLEQLHLRLCNTDGISQCFSNLHDLRRLTLSSCNDLKELPESLGKLRCLEELDLSSCSNLKQLPAGFGELVSLTNLDLSYCESLQELPCDLENSTSLTSLKIHGCKSLACLPHSLGGMSVWGSRIYFDGCSSLSELPEGICEHAMVTKISLTGCSSLKMLPSRFGQLSCLQDIDLSGCESLQELCNDFHCLVGLKSLSLSNCKKLSSLPLDFGKLSSLEKLDLSGCDLMEELCSDFHCLVALRDLNLSGCSNLVSLSDELHLLQSLIRLNLSKCEKLGGEWIDRAGSVRSLWRLDIVHSERMIERWMETKSQKERNLVVVTDIPQLEDEKGERALLLEGVLSKVFDEEGLLLDAHDQLSFHSSSLPPHTPLVFIIDYFLYDWKTLGKNLQQLQFTSKELQIIYVGKHYKWLQSELSMIRILAYTPDNSRTSSFCDQLYSLFPIRGNEIAVFRSTDELEQKGLKCLSAWEDISYTLDPVTFLINTPRESNIELLRELLVTEKTDYLLLNENHKVKIADQEGKIILLLVTDVDENQVMSASAVKEMYVKMQERGCNHLFQVVWVPFPQYRSRSWEELEIGTAHAPWPRVPNPWLVLKRIHSLLGGNERPCVCVVDEKGRISNKDALATIDRWGEEAFPFSEAREEELWKAEWEAFKFNSLSSFQFLFQNPELLPNRERMVRGGMMLLCVGPPEKMKEVVTDLNRGALTMLEIDFHVIYVAHSDIRPRIFDEMARCQKMIEEMKESEKCSIETLPLCDVYKFWRRVEHLQKDLIKMGTEERIVKARKMVLALASADDRYWLNETYEINILVVDGNGEMVSGRGMEMVELLCHGEEESKVKFVEEIREGGVEKSVERRWRDGIIHPKHYPQHPLLRYVEINNYISCSLCGLKAYQSYQCNVKWQVVKRQ